MSLFGRCMLCVGLIFLLTAKSEDRTGALKFGTDKWLPYENISNTKSPGYSTEIIRSVFDVLNIPIEVHQYPWARAQLMVYTGKLDGLFTAFKSEERLKFCYFPNEPLTQDQWVIFVKKRDLNRLPYRKLQDLLGKRVGVVRGAAVSPEFWKFVKEHKNYEEVANDDQSFKMLDLGRFDYIVASEINGLNQIRSMNLGNEIVPLSTYPLKKDYLFLMFSKSTVSPMLVNSFSTALREFKKTEKYQAIYKKYLGSLYYP